ncbi:MAG: lysine transporter LysE [Promethearchaeota archaeon]|nr:MAG: lysine transporter LysE [Candidatus Lokiarchaeota archaeon]
MLEIFLFSFLIALTGALSPGPVLTYTIYKSLNEKRGYLAGFFIILGHATLELALITLLLLGAYLFFQNVIVLSVIGIVGGILLIIFGCLVIRDVYKGKYEIDLSVSEEDIKGFKGNSFLGGIIVSISNPFWTLWWAVIGLSFMINFHISFENPTGLLLFYLGHELGDFVWYIPISIFAYYGGKSINLKVYKYVLIACGVFMIGFGIYLALNIIFFPPEL